MQFGIDYTIEDGNKWVFTRHFLLKRGYCCKNSCRNCPYDDDDKNDNQQTESNMATDLYFLNKTHKPAVVQSDDLVFDGEKIIVPGYWSESLLEFLNNANIIDLDAGDLPDLTNFKEFLSKVIDHQQEKQNNDGN